MPSSHLILCRPLLLPPIPPSFRVFSIESTLYMWWPKYWSFSFSISPSNEHLGLISFRMEWLGKFIPRHLILFVAVVNGINSLISLSDFSLLVYINASDFCVLILYPVTLINSLISSSNFLIVSLGFSIYSVIVMFKQWEIYSSFTIWIPFIYFSSLSAVPKTSKTMLNNSHESGHPCLVPDLTGNAFSFSPLKIQFAMGLP